MQHQTEAGIPAPLPRHKLILCTTPRSASNTLTALINAAGIGRMNEYFNPMRLDLAERIGGGNFNTSQFDPQIYCQGLQREFQKNGIFSAKLFFSQFRLNLLNAAGSALFDGATVVYLLRTDPGAQAVSFKTAIETQQWTGLANERRARQAEPRHVELLDCLQNLCKQDRDWRRFFALAGINPITLLDQDVARRPVETVARIAAAMGVEYDHAALAAKAASRGKYEKHADRKQELIAGELAALRDRAFLPETYQASA